MRTGARIGWVIWTAWAVVLVIAVVWSLADALSITPTIAYVLAGLSVFVLLFAFGSTPALFATGRPPVFAVVSAVSGALSVGSLVAVFFGFHWRFIGSPTPAPSAFITDVTAAGQFDSVLAYARGLSYDSVTHSVADSTIIVDSGGVFLTKAWIAPAVGANFVSHGDLYGIGARHGRVVARIRVDTSYGNRGYPALRLPSGVSYVWVDSLEQRDTTGVFRAFIIPDRPGAAVVRFPVSQYSHYYRSRHSLANFPIARWVLHKSNCVNLPCGHNGCCQSCPN
jgi:hypothetical protein